MCSWCLGVFYKNVGRLWRVSDCEEIVGVTHRRWWGWYRFTQNISSIGECDRNRDRYNNWTTL